MPIEELIQSIDAIEDENIKKFLSGIDSIDLLEQMAACQNHEKLVDFIAQNKLSIEGIESEKLLNTVKKLINTYSVVIQSNVIDKIKMIDRRSTIIQRESLPSSILASMPDMEGSSEITKLNTSLPTIQITLSNIKSLEQTLNLHNYSLIEGKIIKQTSSKDLAGFKIDGGQVIVSPFANTTSEEYLDLIKCIAIKTILFKDGSPDEIKKIQDALGLIYLVEIPQDQRLKIKEKFLDTINDSSKIIVLDDLLKEFNLSQDVNISALAKEISEELDSKFKDAANEEEGKRCREAERADEPEVDTSGLRRGSSSHWENFMSEASLSDQDGRGIENRSSRPDATGASLDGHDSVADAGRNQIKKLLNEANTISDLKTVIYHINLSRIMEPISVMYHLPSTDGLDVLPYTPPLGLVRMSELPPKVEKKHPIPVIPTPEDKLNFVKSLEGKIENSETFTAHLDYPQIRIGIIGHTRKLFLDRMAKLGYTIDNYGMMKRGDTALFKVRYKGGNIVIDTLKEPTVTPSHLVEIIKSSPDVEPMLYEGKEEIVSEIQHELYARGKDLLDSSVVEDHSPDSFTTEDMSFSMISSKPSVATSYPKVVIPYKIELSRLRNMLNVQANIHNGAITIFAKQDKKYIPIYRIVANEGNTEIIPTGNSHKDAIAHLADAIVTINAEHPSISGGDTKQVEKLLAEIEKHNNAATTVKVIHPKLSDSLSGRIPHSLFKTTLDKSKPPSALPSIVTTGIPEHEPEIVLPHTIKLTALKQKMKHHTFEDKEACTEISTRDPNSNVSRPVISMEATEDIIKAKARNIRDRVAMSSLAKLIIASGTERPKVAKGNVIDILELLRLLDKHNKQETTVIKVVPKFSDELIAKIKSSKEYQSGKEYYSNNCKEIFDRVFNGDEPGFVLSSDSLDINLKGNT